MKTWKKIKSKKVYSGPFFDVFEDDVFRPDNSKGKYSYITPRTGVMIIPFDGKHIFLVKQFRYTLDRSLWELPAGGAENNNFLTQAKKELKEETGITAKKWKYLAQFAATPSSSKGLGKFYLAQDLYYGEPETEPSESDLIVKKFTLSEIKKMVLSGKIISGWALSALLLFHVKVKKFL